MSPDGDIVIHFSISAGFAFVAGCLIGAASAVLAVWVASIARRTALPPIDWYADRRQRTPAPPKPPGLRLVRADGSPLPPDWTGNKSA